MREGNPEGWREFVSGGVLVRANAEVIRTCQDAVAPRTERKCTILISAAPVSWTGLTWTCRSVRNEDPGSITAAKKVPGKITLYVTASILLKAHYLVKKCE
ncbi:DUF6118 family protein [Methylocystis suflitae]|uniref:DUF6118 family protein n=1 Tax=Methylocystis suflitae TaxID=2951405 RepID=UPI003898E665